MKFVSVSGKCFHLRRPGFRWDRIIALTAQLLGPREADSKKSLATSSFAILLLALSLNKTVTNSNTTSAVLVDIILVLQKGNLHLGGSAVLWNADIEKTTFDSVHLPINQNLIYNIHEWLSLTQCLVPAGLNTRTVQSLRLKVMLLESWVLHEGRETQTLKRNKC